MRFLLLLLVLLMSCQQEKTTDETRILETTHPEWSYDAGIYEVNIRQYTEEGTFEAFATHLPRLKEMGVEILWLMPIHPIGEKNRKGSLGSYYAVKDYFDVNPEFGTKDDFRNLVNEIHNLGMKVIIDWVANHTAWDNNLTETNPEYYNKNSDGNFYPPVAEWEDVIDLNYDNKELWNYMKNALKYWVQEFDIDGYRCDVAAMVPTEFWNEVRSELDDIKPVFMLAEAHEPELHSYAFDMTYNWKLKDIMNNIAKKENDVFNLISHFEEEKILYKSNDFRMTFTTNHDENSWAGTVYERLGEGYEAFGVLTGILPGMMLVYSGQEAGNNKRLKFFDKDLIEWKDYKMFDVYKTLFNLKKNNKALLNGNRGGEVITYDNQYSDKVLILTREKDEDKIVGFFNFSEYSVEFPISDKRIQGNYINVFSGESMNIKEDFILNLDKWNYLVLKK